jgi:photosystem II stability/assembly factor-like uncharacterized protein
MRKSLILIAILLALPAAAQWRRGGLFGADVRALIVDPANPDRYYVGTSGGEVYVSNDGARTWTNPRFGVPLPGYVVDNLLIDRKGRLWAACWGLWDGGVIARSDDGGKTWVRRDAGLEDFSVRAIAIDPHDADFIVAGGLTGVYRSTDGGESWTKISNQINVESLAIDPRTRDRIYVGTWRQGWRTEDGGKTWKLINNGMVLDTDMFAITIEPSDPDSIWVSTCGWVYNTADRGDNWMRYRSGFDNRRIHDIEIDPCDKDSLYAGSVAGLYRTDDHGKSWYVVSDEQLVINSIALTSQRPDRIVMGVEGDGIYVSEDRAKTFVRASDGLRNVRVSTVVADPSIKDRAYAAVAFGGAASGIYASNDAGKTWSKLSTTKLPEVLSLVISDEPDVETRFIAGTDKGFFWSSDGKEWTQSAPSNFPIRVDRIVRFNRTRSFAATSEGVFTTRDAGRSWYRLAGEDLRTVDVAVGSLGEHRALFALTSSGLAVFDGEHWTHVAGSPVRGRTLALRTVAGAQVIFIAGAQGVKAGQLDEEKQWREVEAPDAQYAAVFTGSDRVFLASRQQRELLVGDPLQSDWLSVEMPSRSADVTSVAPDTFNRDRIYVGTLGEGIYVHEGKAQRWTAKKPDETTAAVYSGSK